MPDPIIALIPFAVLLVVIVLMSIYSIGPTQIGLVRKRFGAKLPGDNPLAFRKEAGYQAEMLMPGLRSNCAWSMPSRSIRGCRCRRDRSAW
jgi:hypothetical protein